MSVWSGIAAAGVAIALALAVFGQPTWEWRLDTTQAREVWQYGVFSVHHELYNKTSGQTVTQDYSYADLAASQPHMAQVFGEFAQFFLLGIIAAFGGVALSALSYWKRIRGIFAGLAFLGACASILYATFAIVFSLPAAATMDLPSLGPIPAFQGQIYDPATGTLLAWTPLAGWVLAIVSGLALAWASSDVWHLAPVKKAAPVRAAKPTPVMKAVEVPLAPPPPPTEFVVEVPPEPMIEEVFLIGQNGLLIKHMSRSLMSDKDRDVVGSMISAISSFVREAFSERDGEVHEVTLGDHRFVMCNDSGLVAAVLVKAGQTEDIVHRLRHLLTVLQDRYGARLMHWAGETIEGIEDELSVLWQPYHLPPPPAA
ncbi:MAG TPA: hypothetical protein VEO96_02620 [Thermoplasmata archaeon]|nr:hypothetical protein [Thermoplasmata archaeon]